MDETVSTDVSKLLHSRVLVCGTKVMNQSGEVRIICSDMASEGDEVKAECHTYGFQCSFEILYRLPNIVGRILWMFSSIRLRMYSLFQK